MYAYRKNAVLTKELAAARHASGDSGLEFVDPETMKTYVVIDAEIHRQAMDALRRQRDRDAIGQGIAEMNSGRGIPADEARKLTRDNLVAREQ